MSERTAKTTPKMKVPASFKRYSIGKGTKPKGSEGRGKSGVTYPTEFLQDVRKMEIKERNPDTGNDVLITSLDPYENEKHKEIMDKWYDRWKKQQEKKSKKKEGEGGSEGGGDKKVKVTVGGGGGGKTRRTVKMKGKSLKSLKSLRGKGLGTASEFAKNATSKALGFEDAKAYEKAAKEAKNIFSAKDFKRAVKEEGKQWMQFVSFLGSTAMSAVKKKEKEKELTKAEQVGGKGAKRTLSDAKKKFQKHKETVEKKRAALKSVSDVLMKYTDVAVGVGCTLAFGPLGGAVGAFVTNAVGRYANEKVRKIDELMGVNCDDITDLQKKNCFKKAGLKNEEEEFEAELFALTLKMYTAYGEAVEQAFEDLKNLTPEQIKEIELTYKFEKTLTKASKRLADKPIAKKASEERDFLAEVTEAFNEACDFEDYP